MQIAVVTSFDSRDRSRWSGTPYYMVKSLEKHCNSVAYVCPIISNYEILGKVINKFTRYFSKKKYDYKRSIFLAKRYARLIEKRILDVGYDLIFAPAGAPLIAFLRTKLPIVLTVDTTFSLMKDYYPEFSNLVDVSIKEGYVIAKRAMERANLLLYPSKWAAESAINEYKVDRKKTHVIPYGANLEEDDIPEKSEILSERRHDVCRLLFLGVDWKRKGGEIAFETLVELENFGVSAHLTVCGCIPPKDFSSDRMTVIPFLDKNDWQQRARLTELFLKSHFLFVPTRSEAYGLVFCEGNAYGLPAITTKTGGVTGIVKDGENGFMLPIEARGDRYAKLIAKIFCDEQRYYALVKSSRAAFDTRLNWNVWGERVTSLIEQII
jgi:glycosyltransferase involved in cell wall biosynthesis